MNSFRFLKYKVYTDAKILNLLGQKFVAQLIYIKKFSYADQLDRALLSVILNIAEGTLRKSKKDFARFLEISIFSLNESVACVDTCLALELIKPEGRDEFLNLAEEVARQISGLRKSVLS